MKLLKAKKHYISALTAGVAVALALFVQTTQADTYAETGDAGDLPNTAQSPTGSALASLTAITGTITLSLGISEGDMYRIFISSPSTFSATTTGFSPGVNNFDTQLFLFNTLGIGVYTNDDDPTTGAAQSTLPAGNALMSSLPAGFYYLLVDGSGRFPTDSMGRLIFPNFTDGTTASTGVYGPTGPGGGSAIAGFTGNSNEGGKYSIALTGVQIAAVPEPSTIGLVLAGLCGVAGMRRMRAKR